MSPLIAAIIMPVSSATVLGLAVLTMKLHANSPRTQSQPGSLRNERWVMQVLYIVVPLAMGMAGVALAAFVMAVRHGQFDDLDTPQFALCLTMGRQMGQRLEGQPTRPPREYCSMAPGSGFQRNGTLASPLGLDRGEVLVEHQSW